MTTRIPSEFVPLDVNYAHDRAIRQAGPMAELLFIRSLAYARKMRPVTGGLIPAPGLPRRGTGAYLRGRMAEAWQEGFKQGGPMHDDDGTDAHTVNPYLTVEPTQ